MYLQLSDLQKQVADKETDLLNMSLSLQGVEQEVKVTAEALHSKEVEIEELVNSMEELDCQQQVSFCVGVGVTGCILAFFFLIYLVVKLYLSLFVSLFV